MDFSRFFTIKDFFNYYIAGTIWIADIILLIYLKDSSSLYSLWDSLLNSGSTFRTIFEAIIMIILPYTIGFALGTLSAKITRKLRNKYGGDPIEWIIPENYECKEHKGKRLPKDERERINKVIKGTLGIHRS